MLFRSEYIAFVKARLRDQFLMTDLGPLRYFLGIAPTRARRESRCRSGACAMGWKVCSELNAELVLYRGC